jgi:hypothetical protein
MLLKSSEPMITGFSTVEVQFHFVVLYEPELSPGHCSDFNACMILPNLKVVHSCMILLFRFFDGQVLWWSVLLIRQCDDQAMIRQTDDQGKLKNLYK